eukprot:TRINITY_DN33512_c0_g1_i1.p1 TRINITY_DN33512_c0_g1~~TRINITY_DN33512_c0_g1_i1.p1  ORF type:complete len:292 (+),score=68.69 TRINITY_DN33512_c0_g1_i1:52-876(+)
MWQAEEDGRTALLTAGAGAGQAGGVLEEHAAEFVRLRGEARNRVQAVREGCGGREDVKAAEKAIDELESNRRQVQVQLKLELSGVAGTTRQEWDQRLSEWAKEVRAIREELDSVQSRRSLNLGSVGGAHASAERSSAMHSTEMMERSSAQLQEAKRLALESEQVSAGVLSDLAAQRDNILNVRGNMRTIGTELGQARRSLDRMLALAQRNRTMTIFIAVTFALGLSFWALCVLGLPLKTTLLLALATVLLLAAALTLRRRLKTGRWELPLSAPS